ncbi:TlpA family protein disulfide reductase [Flavihumibacter sp. R14]|nr:TlpA family protein disulfide reductase [Flavihumibacter soli]
MKRYHLNTLLLLVFVSVLSACQVPIKESLKAGTWRATLKTELGAEIPFNFVVIDSADKKVLDIINGKERFRVNEVTWTDDSVFIQMPLFDSEIRATRNGKKLAGSWIKHLADSSVSMKFDAAPDASWRFFNTNVKTRFNINGRWSTNFINRASKDTTHAIGEFKQNGTELTGTFLTTTGDYRFLEGRVSNDKLYLSTFDGSHAYLFTGRLLNDSTIVDGKFYSGLSSVEDWSANKDDKAILPDAYSLTALKAGHSKIDFSFPDLQGNKVSLSDPKFKNKVVVVQFFGSWCPNCMDETAYLAPFYKKYKDRGVEVVGLAYERSTDFKRAQKNVGRMKKRFDVTYDMLVTGYTNDKEEVAKSLPMLNQFVAFPTTVLIDKSGKVRKIHTGFTGPGTGRHYTEFVEEFEGTINDLLTENN